MCRFELKNFGFRILNRLVVIWKVATNYNVSSRERLKIKYHSKTFV